MRDNRNTLLAFLVGGAVGAGLALLFAPYSGCETRRKLKEGAEDAGEWVIDRVHDAKNKVDDNVSKLTHMVGDKKADIQAAYEAGKEAYHKGRERLTKES